MLTVREILGIALRYATRMADAMVAACVAWSLETGEPLDLTERAPAPPMHEERPGEEVDWDRMVRGNSDSRWQHT